MLSPADRHRLELDLVRLADGDRGAFDSVFALAWPFVRALAARTVPPEDAEEVAQRTLLSLFRRASELDPERDAVGWIATLAFWEIKSERTRRRRERARRGDLAGLAEAPAAEASPEQACEQADLVTALRELVGELPARDVETLRAYALGQRPPGATYRKRLERSLARLGQLWRARHE